MNQQEGSLCLQNQSPSLLVKESGFICESILTIVLSSYLLQYCQSQAAKNHESEPNKETTNRFPNNHTNPGAEDLRKLPNIMRLAIKLQELATLRTAFIPKYFTKGGKYFPLLQRAHGGRSDLPKVTQQASSTARHGILLS